MNQILHLFRSLTPLQRIMLAAAVAAVLGGLAAFSRWSHYRDFRPLYTNLPAEDASAVLTRLRERGVEFQLRDGGTTLLVPSARVDELRIELAGAGVPRSGRAGFELFDKNNFGATEFAEQVNFHRALEGELERSVMALAEVEQARVHITLPKDSVFLESRRPAKASVMVKLRPGARLAAQSVAAICHLTASAVEGLQPDAVTVVDMMGQLLSRPHRPLSPDGIEPTEGMLEFRTQVERDLAAKISATLEPLLGADKFRAGVSAECDFTSGEQSEELYDPNRTAVVTSSKSEDSKEAPAPAGVPGTASNLPRPASRPVTQNAGFSRRTESTTYQPSRTVRRIRLPQGALKRLSVSLLVDYAVRWEGQPGKQRRIVEPVAPEKLKVIRELVAGAVGLVPDRGDQLVIETLPFESTLTWEPLAPPAARPAPSAGWLPPWLTKWIEGAGVLAAAGASLAGLVLIIGGLWLILRRRIQSSSETYEAGHALPAGPVPAGSAAGESAAPLIGEALQRKLSEQAALKEKQAAEALNALKLPPVATQRAEVLTRHLTDEAKKDPVGIAKLVRSLMNEER
jgi:flagellar M-ring protein FliF